MALTNERLREIVLELVSRPGHEKVRALVYELLVQELGASSTEVDFERPVPEVHGRIDALLGRTVIELKSDLRRETREAKEELTRYLTERESQTGEHFVGIATDGATFVPFELRNGNLRELPSFTPRVDAPRDLTAWLSAAVAVAAELQPTPEIVKRELGKNSLAWLVANEELTAVWAEVRDHPDVRLKRELWARLLERVYGASVDNDALFFQHTYLSVVAKTMAVHVLGLNMPNPQELLNGEPLQQVGISGVVESDFFDWPLSAQKGPELVRRIALQAARFKLRDVATDVLKGLYESLVDPEQRHELGEYYTPDWLAARICQHTIDNPLEQRVLDPACGSGTFLFHAIRRYLTTAVGSGLQNSEALLGCAQKVMGIDVHPVAVQIARVTYLLAIGEELLRARVGSLTVPVYMGDSLQWNTESMIAERQVIIEEPETSVLLEFPFLIARDPALFDAAIGRMLNLSEQNAQPEALAGWLAQQPDMDEQTVETLTSTYLTLRDLQQKGRNHIWGFVARNLVRPVWLSQPQERAHVVIGNPPWLAYNFMSPANQERFKQECERLGVWVGGRGITPHQDLCAYFYARCVELYLNSQGKVAFVMPYASLSRRPYEHFRSGWFQQRGRTGTAVHATIRFTEAWTFDETVQPLFPVPSCVLFAKPEETGPLPKLVSAATGALPRRDATQTDAEAALSWREIPWPMVAEERENLIYRDVFRQGAIVVPRMLWVVERIQPGRLGENPTAPMVKSRQTNQEKSPWKTLTRLQGNVETQFIRPLYLGESIAPYRLLEPTFAIIPQNEKDNTLFSANSAQQEGYLHLAQWLTGAEHLWQEYGRGTRTMYEQLDFYRQLSSQFPSPSLKVVYSKAGTLQAAAILRDSGAIIDHTLYWGSVRSEDEAQFLIAIFNSETARIKVEDLQAKGQWGARHFDKVMLGLPIPKFNSKNSLHKSLTEAAHEAEEIAAAVPLKEGEHFTRTRSRIRDALKDQGLAQKIDTLVATLLGPVP